MKTKIVVCSAMERAKISRNPEVPLSHSCRACCSVVAASLLFLMTPLLQAQRPPAAAAPAANADAPPVPVPPEKSSVTSHELTIGDKPLRYTATAGNLLIRGDDDQPNASVFYVAYTLDGVADPLSRPVTFLYNGGPGSASMWLHMGSI